MKAVQPICARYLGWQHGSSGHKLYVRNGNILHVNVCFSSLGFCQWKSVVQNINTIIMYFNFTFTFITGPLMIDNIHNVYYFYHKTVTLRINNSVLVNSSSCTAIKKFIS